MKKNLNQSSVKTENEHFAKRLNLHYRILNKNKVEKKIQEFGVPPSVYDHMQYSMLRLLDTGWYTEFLNLFFYLIFVQDSVM